MTRNPEDSWDWAVLASLSINWKHQGGGGGGGGGGTHEILSVKNCILIKLETELLEKWNVLCDRGQSPAEPHEYINIYVIFTADIKKYKLMFTVHCGFKYLWIF